MITLEKLLQKIRAQECTNEELNTYIKETLKYFWGDEAAAEIDNFLIKLFEAMAQNNTINTLEIINRNISGQGAQLIAKFMQERRQLTALNVSHSCLNAKNKDNMAIAEALKTNDSLLSLDHSNVSLFSCATIFADVIKSNKTLTSLNLEHCSIIDKGGVLILEAMKHNTSIRILNIGSNSFKERSFQALIELLKMNQVLTDLNCSNNDFTSLHDDQGVTEGKMIAEALQQNKTLTRFSFNSLTGSRAGTPVFETLRTNLTLTHLSLQGHSLIDLEPQIAYQAIKSNTQLKTLAFGGILNILYSGVFIKPETLNAIFKAIGDHQGIKTLDLRHSKFDGNDIKVLAETLKQNKSLTHLELQGNPLGSEGVKTIVDSLMKNRTLLYLGLAGILPLYSYNQLGETIAELLKSNHTLQTLILDRNELYNTETTQLSEGLKHNCGLTELSLSDNHISQEGIISLFQSLGENRSLSKLNVKPENIFSYQNLGLFYDDYLQKIMKILEKNQGIQRERREMHRNIASAFLLSVDTNGNIALVNGAILFPALVSLIFQYADCSASPCIQDETAEASSEKQNKAPAPAQSQATAITPMLAQQRTRDQQRELELLDMYNAYTSGVETDTSPKGSGLAKRQVIF